MTQKTPSSAPSQFTLTRGYLEVLQRYPGHVIAATLCTLCAASSVLWLGWGIRHLIDGGFQDATRLRYDISLLVIGGSFLAIASFGRSYLSAWIGEQFCHNLRQSLFTHLMQQDIRFFETHASAELSARLNTDITILHNIFSHTLGILLRNVVLFGGALTMMFMLSPYLCAVASFVIPAILLPVLFFIKIFKKQSQNAQKLQDQLLIVQEECLSAMRTCYSFNHEHADIARFKALNQQYAAARKIRLRTKSWLAFLIMFFTISAVCGLIWVGGTQVLSGQLQPGILSSFIYYAILAAASASAWSDIAADMSRARAAAERLDNIFSTSPQIRTLAKPRSLPLLPRGMIAFHNVSFAYPAQQKKHVLQDITFSIVPGETVAIVGPSGSGKSTLLALLQRFYDTTEGHIYVDGVDIRQAPVSELRRRFGVVPQDPVIFSQSFYENVLYGAPSASESEIWQAISGAHLTDLVQSLPQGIDTFLGVQGIRLSGGQRQRLAIARVLLRNAPILLLDEATSALDAENEQRIQESLQKLMATRTTIVVAHRLATVLQADRIIVLDQGRIDAIGTHAELISEQGLYRRLAMLQFTDSPHGARARSAQKHHA